MRALAKDPRCLQVAFLGSFVLCGAWLGVVPLWQPPLCLGAALLSQRACERLRGLPQGPLLSPLITGLGLSLLLRSDLLWIPPLAAAGAIASKFFVRWSGKHLFNPANLGLVASLLLSGHAWASPSQWGESTSLLFFFLALGLAVVVRALRSDVSFAFLGFWILLKAARVLYLGQRLAVLEHQLAIGSLVVFTFFMISDPKTTPDSRAGRICFALGVAALAFVLQHRFWVMNAPVWALFLLSPAVPLLDRIFRGARYQWPAFPSSPQLNPVGAR